MRPGQTVTADTNNDADDEDDDSDDEGEVPPLPENDDDSDDESVAPMPAKRATSEEMVHMPDVKADLADSDFELDVPKLAAHQNHPKHGKKES